jgi:hypothetical protein
MLIIGNKPGKGVASVVKADEREVKLVEREKISGSSLAYGS